MSRAGRAALPRVPGRRRISDRADHRLLRRPGDAARDAERLPRPVQRPSRRCTRSPRSTGSEVFVVDTFIYPTKHLVLLSRRDVEVPRSIGIVPATKGYVDLSQWEEVIDVVSKPVVGEGLLRGEYDSGLTHMEHFEEHADELRLDLDIGEIDTTWVVYGREKRFRGEVIGIPSAAALRAGRRRRDEGPAGPRLARVTIAPDAGAPRRGRLGVGIRTVGAMAAVAAAIRPIGVPPVESEHVPCR